MGAEAWSWATWLPIVVSVVALAVAGITAWATFVGPRSAAELAEQLRAASSRVELRDATKRFIFFTLMQERAAPYTQEAVRAFNSIDFAFHDDLAIREAWAKYHRSQDRNRQVSQETRQQYFVELLLLMANNIGIENIRSDDMMRFYAPDYLMRKLSIESMHQDIQERELEKLQNAASANTAVEVSTTTINP